MNQLTLRQLRYFRALALHGHFGTAAAAVAISQPALSAQVREMEEELGAPLVERGSRKIRLTPLGQIVAAEAEKVLHAMDDLARAARLSQDPFSGTVSIGMIPTIAPYMLSQVIRGLGRKFPALTLQPREAVTRELVADLLDGKLDAAIVALPLSEPQLTEQPLFDDDFFLARPIKDAKKPPPRAEDLKNMNLILLKEGHCLRDQSLSACNLPRTPGGRMIEGTSLSTLVQMVSAGIGVTLIPEMAVPFETRAAKISVTPLAKPRPKRTIGMVWRKSSPMAENFIQIAEVIAKSRD